MPLVLYYIYVDVLNLIFLDQICSICVSVCVTADVTDDHMFRPWFGVREVCVSASLWSRPTVPQGRTYPSS